MKLIYFGLWNSKEPNTALRNMLRSIADEYVEMAWASIYNQKEGGSGVRERLLKLCSLMGRDDVLFMHIQHPDIVNPETLSKIDCIKINWTGDVRTPLPQWYIDCGKHCDITLFTNDTDVKIARAAGINAGYFQVSADHNIYTPKGAKQHNIPPIVFAGNNYGIFPLSSLRLNMVESLRKAFQNRFMLMGNNAWQWNMYPVNFNGELAKESAAYRNCKIAINLSHFNYERYSSDRIFRIMMSGAFCLSHHYQRIEEDFIPLVHLDTWKTLEELHNKIHFYLAHEPLRKKIAEDGYEHVMKNHSYHKRAEELKKILRAIKKERNGVIVSQA